MVFIWHFMVHVQKYGAFVPSGAKMGHRNSIWTNCSIFSKYLDQFLYLNNNILGCRHDFLGKVGLRLNEWVVTIISMPKTGARE